MRSEMAWVLCGCDASRLLGVRDGADCYVLPVHARSPAAGGVKNASSGCLDVWMYRCLFFRLGDVGSRDDSCTP